MGLRRNTRPSGTPDVEMARTDGGCRALEPDALPDVPTGTSPLAGISVQYHRPRDPDSGDQPSAKGGRSTRAHWDNCRILDLEGNLEASQATYQSLSFKQERQLQEVLLAWADLCRAETNP